MTILRQLLTIGGQARERGAYYRQYLFGASEPKHSDGYLLPRFRLSADLQTPRHLGHRFTVGY